MPYIPNSVISGGPPGSQGPPGVGASFEYELASGTSAGATSLTLDRSLPSWLTSTRDWFLIIDPGSANTEIRTPKTISGASISSLDALSWAHAADVPVFLISGNSIPAGFFGVKGDGSTDDWAKLQAGINETQFYKIWLDGSGLNTLTTFGQPLVMCDDARLRHFYLQALSSFAPVDTWGGAIISAVTRQAFTADAATNVFTCPADIAGPPGTDGAQVVFNAPNGQSLPTGVTAGRIYYYKTVPTARTFTVSETIGGATLDVGSGTGIAYHQAVDLARPYLDDVRLEGGFVAGDLNGVILSVQQPVEIKKLRVDNCKGIGLILIANQAELYNVMLVGNGMNLDLPPANGTTIAGNTETHWYGLNSELATGTISNRIGGQGHVFYSPHTEDFSCVAFQLNVSRGTSFYGGYMTSDDDAFAFFELNGDSSGVFNGIHFVPETTAHVIIDDNERTQTLTAGDLIGTNYVLGHLFQPTGTGTDSKWEWLDLLGINGSGRIFTGSGAPGSQGVNGDFYFRSDTPGSANQRLYVKSGGAWTGIL